MPRSFNKDIAGNGGDGDRAAIPCRACPLRRRECFQEFSPEELAFMERFKSGERHVPANANILEEGAGSDHFYTVLEGWVFRSKTLPDGRRQILNFGMPGDLIGLQGAVMDVMQHTIQALTPVRLCVFTRASLWDLFTRFPSLSYDVTWLASRQERLLDEQLLAVGQRRADERVAFVLVGLYLRAKQVGLVTREVFDLPLTQQHLADSLGFSLVHTNKTLKRMESRGLLRWRGGELDLRDLGALGELAQIPDEAGTRRPLL